ncbi:MAG TPA: hypothetical protein VNK03_03325 [Gammaproteobacteria bacterium]|nr:hypothetical protein [Gammaproteobacteria bacterium]
MMHSLSQDQLTPLSLKEVGAAFEQWRATRAKKSKIPEALWQQVVLLLRKYPISKVTKTLNLSGGQVKAKMQSMTNTNDAKHKLPTFVPVNIPLSVEEPIVGKIEIKRSDGAVLSIDRLDQATLTNLLTQFMRVV